MAENSKIEWCDHTFNPWMGCTRVSPGCQHCYAESLMDARYGKVKWGPQGTRVRMSAAYWKQALKWEKDNWYECHDCGWRGSHDDTLPHAEWQREICPACKGFNTEMTRQRVFCASLADVFEDRDELIPWRDELLALIEATPNLDWLLLTKRPEKVTNMIPYSWLQNFPQNIWMGTSVENQKYADERIPALLRIPAKVRFLSCEPLLGEIDLSWIRGDAFQDSLGGNHHHAINAIHELQWVICGGESGPQARPMDPDWARSLRDQCHQAEIPFLFKQWGEWAPNITGTITSSDVVVRPMKDRGEMVKIGKHKAGRLLDGVEWSQFPS